MRIDLFLKSSRIVKRRSLAKELCDKGMVKINGKTAKASREVSEGDEIEIDTLTKYLKVKVLEIPKEKNISKKRARELYKIIEERKKDIREIIDLL